MEPIKIARHVVRSSGLSDKKAANKAGRGDRGFDPYIYEQHEPSLSVLATICDACEYDLLVRNRNTGEETIIDSPGKE